MEKDSIAFSDEWNDLNSAHLAWLISKYRINYVLDAGANTGQFVQRLRCAGYTGRVASFEPVPRFYSELHGAAADDPLWTTYPFALGSQETSRNMYVTDGPASSFLAPNDYGRYLIDELNDVEIHGLPIRTLDTIIPALTAELRQPRLFLKLDTQGYDLEVFAGLGEARRHVVALQSELSVLPIYDGMPGMLEALAVYRAAGFDPTGIFPVSFERLTGRVLEFDCVMISGGEAAGLGRPCSPGSVAVASVCAGPSVPGRLSRR
jgi:FkbM family methyltransferase